MKTRYVLALTVVTLYAFLFIFTSVYDYPKTKDFATGGIEETPTVVLDLSEETKIVQDVSEELKIVKQPLEKKRVAVVVSLTKESHEGYLDLLAPLAQSVNEWRQSSIFDIDLIAITKLNMTKSHRKLKAFGYKVVEKALPVEVSELPEGRYKRDIDKSGCCGISELMKLYVYTMTEYYRVLHLDADMLVLQNLDEIMSAPEEIEFMYTNSTLDGEYVSGGFLLVRPSIKAFNEIMDIIRSADFQYNSAGWKKSGIGYTWGGETVQGVLPYYYLKQRVFDGSSARLNRCTYNNQGCELCRNTPLDKIKVVHMTLCQKPFNCKVFEKSSNAVCMMSHRMWWEKMEKFCIETLKVKPPPRCASRGTYTPITGIGDGSSINL